MKPKPRGPEIPEERHETIRRKIFSLLQHSELSAYDLSGEIGIGEKAVYEHLVHIERSAGKAFKVRPAVCKKCGFVFRKREKLRKPGRCPLCRGEAISDPLFSIQE